MRSCPMVVVCRGFQGNRPDAGSDSIDAIHKRKEFNHIYSSMQMLSILSGASCLHEADTGNLMAVIRYCRESNWRVTL